MNIDRYVILNTHLSQQLNDWIVLKGILPK